MISDTPLTMTKDAIRSVWWKAKWPWRNAIVGRQWNGKAYFLVWSEAVLPFKDKKSGENWRKKCKRDTGRNIVLATKTKTEKKKNKTWITQGNEIVRKAAEWANSNNTQISDTNKQTVLNSLHWQCSFSAWQRNLRFENYLFYAWL